MEEESRYALQEENADLLQKVEYLETLVEVHHIAKFEENIHGLKLSVRSGLRQLAAEFQAMEHDPRNAERVKDLIAFLRRAIAELEMFSH